MKRRKFGTTSKPGYVGGRNLRLTFSLLNSCVSVSSDGIPTAEPGPKASNGDPLGGQSYWVANLEYIQSVKGPLRIVAFLDAGSLNTEFADLAEGNVEVAVGLGLPIGPVRLEYGHSLTQDPGEPSGTFHFAIGTAF